MNFVDKKIRANLYSHISDEGMYKTEDEGMIREHGEPKLIPSWTAVDELDLIVLKNLSRYLSDALLQNNAYVLLTDHLEYWAWTAAYASQYIPMESKYGEFLRDYYNLIQLVLLQERHQNLDFETQRKVEALNRSIGDFARSNVLKFVTLNSFPVWEGLLRRACEAVRQDGKAIERVEFENARVDVNPVGKTRVRLGQVVRIWQWYEATPIARKALSLVDDLERYDLDRLASMYGNIEADEEEDGFIDILVNIRNSNLHGENWTALIGAIVLNLISLLIWEIAPTSRFQQRTYALRKQSRGDVEDLKEEHLEFAFGEGMTDIPSGTAVNLYPI